jgi:hypothetical protein
MLLIVALRTGNVNARSIHQLLDETSRRPSLTIEWAHPQNPVFCALGKRGTKLLVDRPANNDQLTRLLIAAALHAGHLKRIRAHDLRRGMFRDVANLNKNNLKGLVDQPAAVAAGGHGLGSGKLTLDYTGWSTDDMWSKRLHNDYADPAKAIARVDEPMFIGTSSSNEIDTFCLENSWDPTIVKYRDRARKALQKRRIDTWMESQRQKSIVIHDPILPPINRQQHDQPNTIGADFAKNNDSGETWFGHDDEDTLVDPSLTADDDDDLYKDHDDDDDDNDDDAAIDPQLLHLGEDLEQLVVSADTPQVSMDASSVQEMISDHLLAMDASNNASASPYQSPSAATLSDMLPIDFVARFSTINISISRQSNVAAHQATKSTPLPMNSKDPVSLWVYVCKNAQFGCSFQSTSKETLRKHGVTCKLTSKEAFETQQQLCQGLEETKKAYPCTFPNCTKSYSNKPSLRVHVNIKHSDKWPRPCPDKGCDQAIKYSPKSLYRHQDLVHPKAGWRPMQCSYPACTSKTEWAARNNYVHHLLIAHGVKGAAVASYTPNALSRKTKMKASPCPVDDCSHGTVFTRSDYLHRHLVKSHDWTTSAVEVLIDSLRV